MAEGDGEDPTDKVGNIDDAKRSALIEDVELRKEAIELAKQLADKESDLHKMMAGRIELQKQLAEMTTMGSIEEINAHAATKEALDSTNVALQETRDRFNELTDTDIFDIESVEDFKKKMEETRKRRNIQIKRKRGCVRKRGFLLNHRAFVLSGMPRSKKHFSEIPRFSPENAKRG